MKVIIQRVNECSVVIDKGETRSIGAGLLALFGAGDGDVLSDALLLAKKTAKLRIFSDSDGKLNLSAQDLGLSVMAVSNFTLFADSQKGNRPSFAKAAKRDFAAEAYDIFVEELKKQGLGDVQTGKFGADMQISLVNDGPVTIILDTEEWRK
ncbi:MAG: D-aminoacyl-tRNA deacylase [Oscillospiraceae bacterium]